MVATKGWDDFQGHWRLRKQPGIIRGADPDMSLTSGGHVVEVARGNFFRTTDIVQAEDPPALDDLPLVEERSEPADIRDKKRSCPNGD